MDLCCLHTRVNIKGSTVSQGQGDSRAASRHRAALPWMDILFHCTSFTHLSFLLDVYPFHHPLFGQAFTESKVFFFYKWRWRKVEGISLHGVQGNKKDTPAHSFSFLLWHLCPTMLPAFCATSLGMAEPQRNLSGVPMFHFS